MRRELVRGDGLTAARLSASDVKDAPEAVTENATAAFNFNNELFQVPDLDGLQKKVSAHLAVA